MANYNKFHKKTRIQTKIINSKNFTYHYLIKELERIEYKNKKILDIGCGSGATTFYLARKALKVYGIDISKRAVELCQQSRTSLGLEGKVIFRIMNFPQKTPRDKFDIIICSEVLEHLENDILALKQIKKILKPKGIVIISVPSKNAPLYKWGLTSNFDRGVGHLRRYSIEDLSVLLKKTGFTVIEVKKNEGLLRNFLFLNRHAGRIIRFLKSYLSDVVTLIDKALIPLFGESNILIVAKNKKV